jgi:hypothetical protein
MCWVWAAPSVADADHDNTFCMFKTIDMSILPRLLFVLVAFFPIQQAVGQRIMADEAWRADIDVLRQQVKTYHPTWYADQPAGAFDKALDAVAASMSGKSDLQIALDLQAVVAGGGDSQTKLDLTPLLQRAQVIPIGFGAYADGMYLPGGAQAFEKAMGRRILSINGRTPEAALDMMRRFVAVENDYTLGRDGVNWLRFPAVYRYAGLSADDTLRLRLEPNAGQPDVALLYPMDVRRQGSDMMPVSLQPDARDLRWQPTQSLYELFWLEEHQTIYFQMNRSLSREMALTRGDSILASQLPEFQPYADSLLALVDRQPAAKLLIDLRFNSDGHADDAIALLQQLLQRPVGQEKNRLFLATNAYTQNGALETAIYFHRNSKAVLVGTPSGQQPVHFHTPYKGILPNSRIPFQVSTSRLELKKWKGNALMPHVSKPLYFDDFRNGRDPVLDYVRAQ